MTTDSVLDAQHGASVAQLRETDGRILRCEPQLHEVAITRLRYMPVGLDSSVKIADALHFHLAMIRRKDSICTA